MLPDRRAIVFDLDDTLYPYDAFLRSGFAAIARHLDQTLRIRRSLTMRLLDCAARGPLRGREIQALLHALDLPMSLIPALCDVLRSHTPALELPRASRLTLGALRRRGWRLGILTNGAPDVQRRKVYALGLTPLVDRIVYAAEHGDGTGKPDLAPFEEIARRLDTPPGHIVMVGNDERCDVSGALDAGMVAIRCAVWTDATPIGTRAMATIARLSQLPSLVPAVIAGRHSDTAEPRNHDGRIEALHVA